MCNMLSYFKKGGGNCKSNDKAVSQRKIGKGPCLITIVCSVVVPVTVRFSVTVNLIFCLQRGYEKCGTVVDEEVGVLGTKIVEKCAHRRWRLSRAIVSCKYRVY